MDRPSHVIHKSHKLTVDTFNDEDLVYVRFSGALDEDFVGKELAEKLSAPMVILQLADIQRITSFGIREWMDFIQVLDQKADHIVLAECAQKIVDQINMVANFTGKGRVFSFYAPYRCDECDAEQRVILQLDRDWEVIKSLRPPELPCANCGELQQFDEDPITYFSYIVGQGPIELPQEVRVLLTSPAQYRPSVLELSRRMEVDKLVEGNFTYVRLSGDLNASFPRSKLADGLEGTVIVDMTNMGRLDPAGAAEWRTFLQMLTPAITSFSIEGMPSLYLEKLGHAASLGARAQVLDFSLTYACERCGVTAPYDIDVAKHYEQLSQGATPVMTCRQCKAQITSTASQQLLDQARTLPWPELSAEARAFIAKAKQRPADRKASEAGVTFRNRRPARGLWLAVIASLAIAGAAVAYTVIESGDTQVVPDTRLGKLVEASAPERPPWLTSDTQLSGDCQTSEKLAISCTGVSTLLADQKQAQEQARDVALESSLRSVGLLIDNVKWTAEIGSVYGRVRQAKVAEFSNEQLRDPGSMHYQRAKEALLGGRQAVIAAARKILGDRVDFDKPTDLYWERYLTADSKDEQYLFFVHYQIPTEAVESMLELFGKSDDALGVTLVTAFPGLAWLHPTLEGGVVVMGVEDSYLKEAGLVSGNIITAVQGRPIKDTTAFIQVLDYQIKSVQEGGGDLRLTVMTDGQRTSEITMPADEFRD
jgi:hypothetical protein